MADTTYADIDEFKDRISVPTTLVFKDILLQDLLNVAARIVDANTRRPPEGYEAFSLVEETRYFDDYGSGIISLPDLYEVDPAATLPSHSVVYGTTTLLATEYTLYPYNGRPYTQLRFNSLSPLPSFSNTYVYGYGYGRGYPYPNVALRQVAITGNWGYCPANARPPEVKEATLTQAERMYERFGIKATDIMAAMRDPFQSADPTVLLMLQSLMKPMEQAVG